MARKTFESVDEYIAAQPEGARAALALVRAAIRAAVPGAGEGISYGMPTYRLAGRPMLYFAAWKKHWSLYPATDRLLVAFAEDLARCEVDRGTIRFPLSEPIPEDLVARIAAFRAREVGERQEMR